MFCVEEHKWDYFTRIYIGALGRRPHLGGRILTWGGGVSSPGGDASPRRHCQVGGRYPNLAISKCRRGDEAAEKSPDVGRRYRCDICVSH